MTNWKESDFKLLFTNNRFPKLELIVIHNEGRITENTVKSETEPTRSVLNNEKTDDGITVNKKDDTVGVSVKSEAAVASVNETTPPIVSTNDKTGKGVAEEKTQWEHCINGKTYSLCATRESETQFIIVIENKKGETKTYQEKLLCDDLYTVSFNDKEYSVYASKVDSVKDLRDSFVLVGLGVTR